PTNPHRHVHPFPTRRSSDLTRDTQLLQTGRIEIADLSDRRRLAQQPQVVTPALVSAHWSARGTDLDRAADLAFDLLQELFDAGRDRKSTRLNSSHVAISYAV